VCPDTPVSTTSMAVLNLAVASDYCRMRFEPEFLAKAVRELDKNGHALTFASWPSHAGHIMMGKLMDLLLLTIYSLSIQYLCILIDNTLILSNF